MSTDDLSSSEILALIRFQLDSRVDPSAERIIALANALTAARSRERQPKAA